MMQINPVLYYIPLKKYLTIYDIKSDKTGFPHFLIYMPRDNKKGEWIYKSAKHFCEIENE